MTAQDVLGRLQGVRGGNGQWVARCPAHEDEHPSLSITESQGKILLYCHAGCSYEQIREALGLDDHDGDWAAVEATYDYKDEDGKLLYQVVRLRPKSFRVRVPDGDGWQWTLAKVKERVLYRLPDLLANPDEVVFVVEGEKDVDRLTKAGLLATTNIGGAGKWKPEYTRTLAGRDVVILPDNDVPGQAHGQTVAQALYGQASSVKVINLPGLDQHGDVSDWLSAGHTIQELLDIVEAAPTWEPAPTTSRLEGNAHTYTYVMPAYGVRINLRSVKLHSDATRLTAIMRVYSDTTGARIAGSGAINLAAARTRNSLAKDLEQDRPDVPWRVELERMYTEIEDRLLSGEPRLLILSDEYPDPVTYLLPPLLPDGEPTILYGDGASGKSMFGMLISILVSAGIEHPRLRLAAPEPRHVLYLDWERKPPEARRRLYRLSLGLGLTTPAKLYYRKCVIPLIDDVEAIAEVVQRDQIGLLVIDSLLPATGIGDGRDPAAPASALFEALRMLDTTSLVIGHHGKDRERGIYGSIFFRNLASSVWAARSISEPGGSSLSLGLIHDKANLSGKLPSLGIEFRFDDSDNGRGPITAHPIDITAVPDAVSMLPSWQQILSALATEPLSPREITDATGINPNTVRVYLGRLVSEGRIRKLPDGRYGLTAKEDTCPF